MLPYCYTLISLLQGTHLHNKLTHHKGRCISILLSLSFFPRLFSLLLFVISFSLSFSLLSLFSLSFSSLSLFFSFSLLLFVISLFLSFSLLSLFFSHSLCHLSLFSLLIFVISLFFSIFSLIILNFLLHTLFTHKLIRMYAKLSYIKGDREFLGIYIANT